MVPEWWLKPCLLTHAPQKKWGTPLGPPVSGSSPTHPELAMTPKSLPLT